MTAREYLESKGLVVLGDDKEYKVRWDRSEGDAIRVVEAPLGYVLNTFGSTIEGALQDGGSPYDALMAATFGVESLVEGPDGEEQIITVQRSALELGWAGHFGAWKAAGKLD